MLFFEGLFLLCLLISFLTVYSMVTDNPFVFSSKMSLLFIILAAGSWITGIAILIIAIILTFFGYFINGILLTLIVAGILKLNWHTPPKIIEATKPTLTVSTVNVLVTNKNKGLTIGNELAQENPDIIFMQEYDAHIGQGMEVFLNEYTYCFIADKNEEGLPDLAIYSKIPLMNKRIHYISNRPVMFAEIEHEEQVVTLVNIHTMSPTDSTRSTTWHFELESLRSMLNFKTPAIIAGDFNASISHAPFRNLLRACSLTDMTSFMNTWSIHSSIPDLLHLDHILTTVDFQLNRKPVKTLGEGSDHAPTTVTLSLI